MLYGCYVKSSVKKPKQEGDPDRNRGVREGLHGRRCLNKAWTEVKVSREECFKQREHPVSGSGVVV